MQMLKRPLGGWLLAATALAVDPAPAAAQASSVAATAEGPVSSGAKAPDQDDPNGAAGGASSHPGAIDAKLDAHAELAVGRELFWRAYQKFNAGDYQGAAVLFERSYAIYPQHEVLFNMALANAKAGRCREVQDILATYRQQRRQEKDSEQVASQLAAVGAECSLESDAAVEPAVPSAPEVTAVPSTTVRAAAPNQVAVPPPLVGAVPTPATELPTSAGRNDTPYWTNRTIAGWTLVGAAIVSSGVAMYFGEQRSDTKAELESINVALERGEASADPGRRVAELEQEYQQHNVRLAVSAALAAACAVTGAVILVGFGASEASDGIRVGVGAGPQLSLSGRF
ncbi:MAG TPA: hypothetical protein VI197_31345 [Polyangiaceae bacterium]